MTAQTVLLADDRRHTTADDLYRGWLSELLAAGECVPSVRDPLSVASGFGEADRPYIELRATTRHLTDPTRCLMSLAYPALHLPYCFAYISWFLMGRNDVETLAYYRESARNFSDDGSILCGSFGRRLFGSGQQSDQIASILGRANADPASRRLYAAIISADDTLSPTREFPCAAGAQFFVRNGSLHLATTMRAQEALTILPYDLLIFCALLLAAATEMAIPAGTYSHYAGTFHILFLSISSCFFGE